MSSPSPPHQNSLQLAQILSDLVSLRVCDPAAALALVSARPGNDGAAAGESKEKGHGNGNGSGNGIGDEERDLTRARELVELHYDVKMRHERGELSVGLEGARRDVERAVGGDE